jgi:hypothetical protein
MSGCLLYVCRIFIGQRLTLAEVALIAREDILQREKEPPTPTHQLFQPSQIRVSLVSFDVMVLACSTII